MTLRAWPRHLPGVVRLAVLLSLAPLAAAAPAPAAEFAVTARQAQALGIRLQVLAPAAAAGGSGVPARVVLPASSEYVLSAPLDGLVSQVLVEEGQAVAAGQPLLRLDSPGLGRLQLELLQAASRARLATQAATRETQLYKEGVIPERRLQEADATRREAEATLAQARAALQASGMAPATLDRVIRTNTLEPGLTMTARSAGVVTAVSARPGQRAEPATPLMTLASLGTLWLELQLPPVQAAAVAPGTAVTVPARDVRARVQTVGAVVGSSQTVAVRARVEQGAARLRPGEYLQAALPLPAAAGAWDLPLAAVVRHGGQAQVFVRTAKGFRATPVTVLGSAGQQVRVQGAALRAGDQVAVSSLVALKAAWLGEGGGE